MKKTVACLAFALLIASLLVGALPNPAQLTLTSASEDIILHGFFDEPLVGDHNIVTIVNFFKEGGGEEYKVRNHTSTTVFDEFSEEEYVGIAYYYFGTNTPNIYYIVNFSITPFFSESASYEVPLQLRVNKHASSANINVNVGTSSKAGTLGTFEEPSVPVSYTAFTTSSENIKEPKFAALKLDLLLNQTEIATKGITAGDDYVATVTATIITN